MSIEDIRLHQAFREYSAEPKEFTGLDSPFESLMNKAKSIGSRIVKLAFNSQQSEVGMTPVANLEDYRRRKEEKRWREGL